MNKTISFNYKELEKFIEEINTKLQDSFSFYLVDNKLALYDNIYDINNNNIKNIKGKITIIEKNTTKEMTDIDLIKQLEDNYLFLNLIRIKSKMTILDLQRLVQINTKINDFYPNLCYYNEYNLKNKLYHLKYAFTNKLETNINNKRIKELFNQINDLAEKIFRKIS